MAKPSRRGNRSSLRIRDFLALVQDGIRARLGDDLGGLDWRQRFGYLQYYRGDPAVHYEIWVQRKTARLEIGLHFEGPNRDRNYAAAAALADRSPEIIAAVGPEYELEEWTQLWTRLHRSFHAPELTPELATEAVQHGLALIGAMEPIIDELGLRAR